MRQHRFCCWSCPRPKTSAFCAASFHTPLRLTRRTHALLWRIVRLCRPTTDSLGLEKRTSKLRRLLPALYYVVDNQFRTRDRALRCPIRRVACWAPSYPVLFQSLGARPFAIRHRRRRQKVEEALFFWKLKTATSTSCAAPHFLPRKPTATAQALPIQVCCSCLLFFSSKFSLPPCARPPKGRHHITKPPPRACALAHPARSLRPRPLLFPDVHVHTSTLSAGATAATQPLLAN